MASAKEKRIVARLEQIKDEASRTAANSDQIDSPDVNDAANLAEEAAALGLELHDLMKGGKK